MKLEISTTKGDDQRTITINPEVVLWRLNNIIVGCTISTFDLYDYKLDDIIIIIIIINHKGN